MVLMENGSLMKVEGIAECSPWSILQYLWPALSDNRYWKPILVFFLSGHLRQVLLYSFFWKLVQDQLASDKVSWSGSKFQLQHTCSGLLFYYIFDWSYEDTIWIFFKAQFIKHILIPVQEPSPWSTWADPVSGCSDYFFFCHQHILQRAVQTSLEKQLDPLAIEPKGSNCFMKGICTRISKVTYSRKPIATCFLFVWFDSLRPLNNLSVMRDGLPGLNQY